MFVSFARSWKAAVLRGVASVVFGLAMLYGAADMSLPSLIVFFGAYSLGDGALVIVLGPHPGRSAETEWLLDGVVAMTFGLTALLWLGTMRPPLVRLFALWAIAAGGLEVIAALRLRQVSRELSLVLAGTGSLLLGLVTFSYPFASAFPFTLVLSFYALFLGASMLVLAVRLHRLATRFRALRMGRENATRGGRGGVPQG